MTIDNKNAYLSRPWLKYYAEDVPETVDIPLEEAQVDRQWGRHPSPVYKRSF
jgi:hypothetical protein